MEGLLPGGPYRLIYTLFSYKVPDWKESLLEDRDSLRGLIGGGPQQVLEGEMDYWGQRDYWGQAMPFLR